MSKYKLLNINIQIDNNLDKIEPYLSKDIPDFFCVQEINRITFDSWKKKYFQDGVFAPMVSKASVPIGEWGVAILSNHKIKNHSVENYDQFTVDYKELIESRNERPIANLLSISLEDIPNLIISTTHFTWAPNKNTTDQQLVNIKYLSNLTNEFDNLILCGDFNSPKNGAVFNYLSKNLVDNIPDNWTTTIDPNIHRTKGKVKLVVDGLFSKGNIKIADVHQTFNLSDHSAISCTVEPISYS